MRQCIVFKPFISSDGREYELRIEATEWTRMCLIQMFVEDDRGVVTAEPVGWKWDGLIEMTQDLRIVILSWAADRCDCN